jgi:hypothetical protein
VIFVGALNACMSQLYSLAAREEGGTHVHEWIIQSSCVFDVFLGSISIIDTHDAKCGNLEDA